MKTFFDHATNAACPQKSTWEISPVGYEWAQAVLLDCKKAQTCKVKQGAQAAAELEKIRGNVLFTFTGASSIFSQHTRKLFSAG